jgi:cytochrome c oxidase cbb3-type subunit 4
METATYEWLRQFADSWGLVYMFAIFVAVLIFIFAPGAKQRAKEAAHIPLDDDTAIGGSK